MGKVIASITTSVDGFVTGPMTGRSTAWARAENACTTG